MAKNEDFCFIPPMGWTSLHQFELLSSKNTVHIIVFKFLLIGKHCYCFQISFYSYTRGCDKRILSTLFNCSKLGCG